MAYIAMVLYSCGYIAPAYVSMAHIVMASMVLAYTSDLLRERALAVCLGNPRARRLHLALHPPVLQVHAAFMFFFFLRSTMILRDGARKQLTGRRQEKKLKRKKKKRVRTSAGAGSASQPRPRAARQECRDAARNHAQARCVGLGPEVVGQWIGQKDYIGHNNVGHNNVGHNYKGP